MYEAEKFIIVELNVFHLIKVQTSSKFHHLKIALNMDLVSLQKKNFQKLWGVRVGGKGYCLGGGTE